MPKTNAESVKRYATSEKGESNHTENSDLKVKLVERGEAGKWKKVLWAKAKRSKKLKNEGGRDRGKCFKGQTMGQMSSVCHEAEERDSQPTREMKVEQKMQWVLKSPVLPVGLCLWIKGERQSSGEETVGLSQGL